jgi:hypothetical protein
MSSESSYFKLDSGEFAGQFQCKYCDKRCAKQNTMYYHVQTKHVQDFKFCCAHCPDKKFVQKSAYQQHMAQAHPEDAKGEENPYVDVSFTCSHPGCDTVAKTKANILVHFARTHCKDWIATYSKDTACKCCNKTFSSSTAYFYHAITSYTPPTSPVDYADMIKKMK